MLHLLRRSRLLALALLLATPALGGAWLQVGHPCPVDAPWLSTGGNEGHGEHDPHSTPGTCHCVNSCQAAAVAAIAAAPVLQLAAAPPPAAPPAFAPAAPLPAFRPADRLPPATAPPTA